MVDMDTDDWPVDTVGDGGGNIGIRYGEQYM